MERLGNINKPHKQRPNENISVEGSGVSKEDPDAISNATKTVVVQTLPSGNTTENKTVVEESLEKSAKPDLEIVTYPTLLAKTPTEHPNEEVFRATPEGEVLTGVNVTPEQISVIQKCSVKDLSPCHLLADCDLSSGVCVCRPGYYGDGYFTCT